MLGEGKVQETRDWDHRSKFSCYVLCSNTNHSITAINIHRVYNGVFCFVKAHTHHQSCRLGVSRYSSSLFLPTPPLLPPHFSTNANAQCTVCVQLDLPRTFFGFWLLVCQLALCSEEGSKRPLLSNWTVPQIFYLSSIFYVFVQLYIRPFQKLERKL